MTKQLDYVDVMRVLLSIVAENPGKIVESGCYFEEVRHALTLERVITNIPSCGVGHWLQRAGVTSQQVGDLDLNRAAWDYGWPVADKCDLGLTLTGEADHLLARFQYHQDRHERWSTALRKAVQDCRKKYPR
jgi:hypothetical protein